MEQTPHGENPFPAETHGIVESMKGKSKLFGVIALVAIAAGVIWYISDTSLSTPVADNSDTPKVQATTTPPAEVAPAEKPAFAGAEDLSTVDKNLSTMDANLKTLDPLTDI